MMEISQDLKDKLKTIELETGFFSHKPKKPRNAVFVYSVTTVALALGIWITLLKDNQVSAIIFLGLAVIQLNSYFQDKQIHKMYSNACEIIGYYKKHEGQEI